VAVQHILPERVAGGLAGAVQDVLVILADHLVAGGALLYVSRFSVRGNACACRSGGAAQVRRHSHAHAQA
jgi:hypothetical protein